MTDGDGEDAGAGPVRWERLADDPLHDCRVWSLCRRRYRHPRNGREGEFFYINSRDWAMVVARTPGGGLVLVRQFRFGSDDFSWEFPGGIVDAGEDPVAAGLRELEEETGYVAERGRVIGTCRPNPAILNNRFHVIFAENARPGGNGTAWDEHEEMEIRDVPEADVFRWAVEGAITHALALNGLLYYRLNVVERAGQNR